jgi:ATP synthase subunit 6
MVKENIGGNTKRSVRFFPFIFSLFIFILIANLIGLIPFSSTVTSYLIVTFAMAIMVLLGVNIIAGRFHGLVYFGHFLPSGCPFPLYPLIIPIEFISYVFRVVSLSVRLFANMMAGHTLLAVLAGFGWTMVTAGSTELLLAHPFPILVVFVLVFLETAVAIIQSYVFTILTCMYLDEAINLH